MQNTGRGWQSWLAEIGAGGGDAPGTRVSGGWHCGERRWEWAQETGLAAVLQGGRDKGRPVLTAKRWLGVWLGVRGPVKAPRASVP